MGKAIIWAIFFNSIGNFCRIPHNFFRNTSYINTRSSK